MTPIKWIQWSAAAAAMMSMVTTQPVLAAVNQLQTSPASTISDVSLSTGGFLSGRVVDPQGASIPEASVVVFHAGQEVARTKTTNDGIFQVAGLRSGVHQVVGDTGTATYRFWAEGTSPPAANRAALIVSNDELVRGQGCAAQCGPRGCAPPCGPTCAPPCAPPCAPACPPNCAQPRCAPACGPFGGCCLRPGQLLVLGGIAAAIAIPIAVSNNDDNPPSS